MFSLKKIINELLSRQSVLKRGEIHIFMENLLKSLNIIQTGTTCPVPGSSLGNLESKEARGPSHFIFLNICGGGGPKFEQCPNLRVVLFEDFPNTYPMHSQIKSSNM